MVAHNFIDETGNKYGRLSVVGIETPRQQPVRFTCICECGGRTAVIGSNLRRGNTASCGCSGAENVRTANTTHGHSTGYTRTPTYRIWAGMWGRAGKRKGYFNVRVCERWGSFEYFLEDMGEAPNGMSLDRFPDNLGDYKPDNCRWATVQEQQNNRTNNKMLLYRGETHTLAEWCRLLNIDYFRTHARLRLGWSTSRAFDTVKCEPTLRNLTSWRDPIDL